MVLQDRLPETCLEQIRAMCRLLYPAHTNIDYFPTNFILQNGVPLLCGLRMQQLHGRMEL